MGSGDGGSDCGCCCCCCDGFSRAFDTAAAAAATAGEAPPYAVVKSSCRTSFFGGKSDGADAAGRMPCSIGAVKSEIQKPKTNPTCQKISHEFPLPRATTKLSISAKIPEN
ncbi:hypothetical protein COCNU_14G003720 [Cocos nucifera]|uniref:Uncharacterized protein n=1 Tax=Cocos nucifera TaxID=13894 RepID=A0A8K0IUG1_COCNU|nr:hypothetical protein COCNU_14G003720 [Cocos nucifera]